MSDVKPSAGALRAAKKIAKAFQSVLDHFGVKWTPEKSMLTMVRIIDEETAAPDLLAALKEWETAYSDDELQRLAECTSDMGEIDPGRARRHQSARAAIAKAEGGAE